MSHNLELMSGPDLNSSDSRTHADVTEIFRRLHSILILEIKMVTKPNELMEQELPYVLLS